MKQETSLNTLWFTLPIAILLLAAASGGLLLKDLYRDVPGMVAQAKGQDLVSLAVVLPTLLITAIFTRRGFVQAHVIWLGGLAYMVYTYASYAFAIRYNPFFLVYIALLGLSLYALIVGMAALDMERLKGLFTEKTPVKAVSLFLAVLAFLFYAMWLSELIPALLAGEIPQSILDDGTPTNAIHVLDMAWILPAFAVAAINLWRRHASGYSLAGISLTFFVLLASAALAMALLQAGAGSPEALPMAGLFGILIAAAAGVLFWYLKSIRLPEGGGTAGGYARAGSKA